MEKQLFIDITVLIYVIIKIFMDIVIYNFFLFFIVKKKVITRTARETIQF